MWELLIFPFRVLFRVIVLLLAPGGVAVAAGFIFGTSSPWFWLALLFSGLWAHWVLRLYRLRAHAQAHHFARRPRKGERW
ncbi:hypothetical protein [Amycolatopsis sp. NPDC058986]|uniref:hypothetical protein n=1 Tax=unclassified Amycolatopsis TaxID=2618356 RepID=UPI003671BA3F